MKEKGKLWKEGGRIGERIWGSKKEKEGEKEDHKLINRITNIKIFLRYLTVIVFLIMRKEWLFISSIPSFPFYLFIFLLVFWF